jgi:hypothetical protein
MHRAGRRQDAILGESWVCACGLVQATVCELNMGATFFLCHCPCTRILMAALPPRCPCGLQKCVTHVLTTSMLAACTGHTRLIMAWALHGWQLPNCFPCMQLTPPLHAYGAAVFPDRVWHDASTKDSAWPLSPRTHACMPCNARARMQAHLARRVPACSSASPRVASHASSCPACRGRQLS